MLVPRPGDESLHCGGLIAQACRGGRPPFVMVLCDGTATDPAVPPGDLAARHARETAAAVALLGLDRERLLMAGIHDGHLSASGPLFDVVVRAVVAVMWRQDCNVVCAPDPHSADRAEHAAGLVAETVAERSGVGRIAYPGRGWQPGGSAPIGWRLHIADDLSAKCAAAAAHGRHNVPAETELYFSPRPAPPPPDCAEP